MSVETVLKDELKSLANGLHTYYKTESNTDFKAGLDSIIIEYCRSRDELCIKEVLSNWLVVYDMGSEVIEVIDIPISLLLAKIRYTIENTKDRQFTKNWNKLFAL